MKSNLLRMIKFEKLPKGEVVGCVTNKAYESMIASGNQIIKRKQQEYYEAYNNASKINIG
jgi:hypothetical protein